MKLFNLEKALEGQSVVTREGHKVKQLIFFENTKGDFCLAGTVNGNLKAWTKSGRFYKMSDSLDDLFMQSIEYEGWVNIIYGDNGLSLSRIYTSEEEAKLCTRPIIGRYRIPCKE